jgi:ubiquinone/menaquinone biosynthesis C-methylase UbiE
MSNKLNYCCIEPECKKTFLAATQEGLECPNGHFFPFVPGTEVPLFACAEENINEYSLEDAAAIHDNSLRWVFKTFGTDEPSLRRRLVSHLNLQKGQKILVTGVGAGNDLPYIVEMMNNSGEIYAQDYARQMLLAAFERYQAKLEDRGVKIHFSVSDATSLPFTDGYFDVAYHFGGINLFSDIGKGLGEMNRVVKDGGRVLISDEGMAPWLMDTVYGKMLINNNPLYACTIPLQHLPKTARNVKVSWELSNCFYVIEFVVSDQPFKVEIDIPHVGRRGGTIRTRYFGQLEGIDPALRDRIYEKAAKAGKSRVDFLESLLRSGLSKKVS